MIDNVSFTLDGLEEYIAWQSEDKRTLKKINQLKRYYQKRKQGSRTP